jgi:hypothetical protein
MRLGATTFGLMEWGQASASWRTVGGRARLAAGRSAERRRKRLPSCSTLISVGENIGPGTVVSDIAVGGRLGRIGDAVLQLLQAWLRRLSLG